MSRHWSSWTKDHPRESKIRSPMFYDYDDMDPKDHNCIEEGHVDRQTDKSLSPLTKNGQTHRKNPISINSMGQNNDRIIESRLMNGKLASQNGNEFPRRNRFFDDDHDYDDNIKDIGYKCTIDSDSMKNKNSKQTLFLMKDQRKTCDFNSKRSSRENDCLFVPVKKNEDSDESHLLQRSRYTDDSPDREVANTLRDTNGRHFITNGSDNKDFENGHNQRSRLCADDFDVEFQKYERLSRDSNGDSNVDLVRKSRRTSVNDRDNELSRKSSFEYHHNRTSDPNDTFFKFSCSLSNKQGSSHESDALHKSSASSTSSESSSSLTNIDKWRNQCDRDSEYVRNKWDEKNDRHSRPLTPPTVEDQVNDNYKINSCVETASKDPSKDFFVKSKSKCNRDSRDLRRIDKELSRYSDDESVHDCTGGFSVNCRDNDNFSTIERNGTTVIRIGTGSRSPVGASEIRFDRISRRNESRGQNRGFADDEEDSDYEEFFKSRRRTSPSSRLVRHDSV